MKPTPKQIAMRKQWAEENLSPMRDRLQRLLIETRSAKEFSFKPEQEQIAIERIEARLALLAILFSGDYE